MSLRLQEQNIIRNWLAVLLFLMFFACCEVLGRVPVLRPAQGGNECHAEKVAVGDATHQFRLCVRQGTLAHDRYLLAVNGNPVIEGIDDQTTEGISGIYNGRSISLKCVPEPASIGQRSVEPGRSCEVRQGEQTLWAVRVIFG